MKTIKYYKNIFLISLVWLSTMFINVATAERLVKLQDISVKTVVGDDVQIILEFSDMPAVPASFVMDSPPELIFDFVDTINGLPQKKLFQKVSFNLMRSIKFVNNGNKLRMVIALNKIVRFIPEVNGNNLILTIKHGATKGYSDIPNNYDISALDFKRIEDGGGKLILDVRSDLTNIDFKSNDDGQIQIEFKNATIDNKLLRSFDVGDFGTPMKNIVVTKDKNAVVVKITASGEYDKISYHMGDKYIVETRQISETQKQLNKTRNFKFTGEKISLNFQEIEIRAVLQLLADFTGLNIVANESVQGNITLRLDNIPWDQALDFILKSKGLSKRESGNVLLIAPSDELSKYEETELTAIKQLEALESLKTEFIPINYAKASDIVGMIKGDKNSSLLSDRGNINVDSRTNTLLVKDIASKINEMKDLIKILDVPVKQVLIEAYIVGCNEDFTDVLGIKLNGAAKLSLGSRKLGLGALPSGAAAAGASTSTGTTETKESAVVPSPAQTAAGTAQTLLGTTPSQATGQFFDFNAGGNSVLGLALSRLPGGTILNMEIDAGETEGLTSTISKPKILTLDKQSASIETGTSIAYTVPGNTGFAATTSFQKAALSLNVTPQITPNNQISMDLSISNDSLQQAGAGGTPNINTTSLKTNVLVDNGETIVLGGIFTDKTIDVKNKVPYLSNLPLLGKLFQNKKLSNSKAELLVFITPRILQPLDSENRR